MARWGFRSAGPRPDETPHEFTERVFHRSAVHGHASTITDLYVLERYAGRTVAPSELARARAAWRVLRWRRPAPWRR
jgi:hypothetical protein